MCLLLSDMNPIKTNDMKVIFWYEIVCVIFVLSLIPLICGVIILSFMIRHSYRKKTCRTMSIKHKVIFYFLQCMVSLIATCMILYAPSILCEDPVNILSTFIYAVISEIITIPVFYYLFKKHFGVKSC